MVECAGSNWGSPQGLLRAQVSVLWALLLLILPTDLPHCSGHQRGRLSKGQSLTQDKELESRARKSVLCCFFIQILVSKAKHFVQISFVHPTFIEHMLSSKAQGFEHLKGSGVKYMVTEEDLTLDSEHTVLCIQMMYYRCVP